jgi:hypothetical protein
MCELLVGLPEVTLLGVEERPTGTVADLHVTQGTIANKDFTQLAAPTLEALADDGVIVVSTGGRPLDALPPLPATPARRSTSRTTSCCRAPMSS